MFSRNQGAGRLDSWWLNSMPYTKLSIDTGRLKVPCGYGVAGIQHARVRDAAGRCQGLSGAG
jgi:hypothetical protein